MIIMSSFLRVARLTFVFFVIATHSVLRSQSVVDLHYRHILFTPRVLPEAHVAVKILELNHPRNGEWNARIIPARKLFRAIKNMSD